ncbi:MAG TPA: head GIN domain-containing protein [Sphingomicrobium sp.]|nr:head GIN domain-containing protein [Sphingomicrobium sp.]
MTRIVPTLMIALLASACQFGGGDESREPGPAAERRFEVGAFDRISVAGPYEVTVTSGGQPGVTAQGGQAILAETEVVVEGGVLKIRPLKKNGVRWNWGKNGKVRFAVSAAALRGAEIAGSGDVAIDRIAGDFTGKVAGSGDLAIAAVDAGAVGFSIAGSGNVRAAGRAKRVEVNIAGSGDVDLAELAAETADVSIAGSGNVTARATSTADVSIMGSGDVAISGGAKCSVSKNGSGNVTCS